MRWAMLAVLVLAVGCSNPFSGNDEETAEDVYNQIVRNEQKIDRLFTENDSLKNVIATEYTYGDAYDGSIRVWPHYQAEFDYLNSIIELNNKIIADTISKNTVLRARLAKLLNDQ